MLNDTINKDYLEAYKAGDSFKVSVLRLIKSSIKNAEILIKKELSDLEVTQILQKEAKTRQDTIVTYQKADRLEAAQKEKDELLVIEHYLPEEISQQDLSQKVHEIIDNLSDDEKKNIGKIIETVIKQIPNADGSKVSQIVRDYI